MMHLVEGLEVSFLHVFLSRDKALVDAARREKYSVTDAHEREELSLLGLVVEQLCFQFATVSVAELAADD